MIVSENNSFGRGKQRREDHKTIMKREDLK
jgi:hypothetical protein